MKKRFYLTTATLVLLSACSSTEKRALLPHREIRAQIVDLDHKGMQLTVKALKPGEGLSIHCPVGMKCPSKDYGLFLTGPSQGAVYLGTSFEIHDTKITLKLLKSKLKTAIYKIDMNDFFKFPDWNLTNAGENVVRKEGKSPKKSSIEFQSFDHNVLKGQLRHVIMAVSAAPRKTPKECEVPADAPSPDGCVYSFNSKIPLTIDFELNLKPEVIDCTVKPTPKFCG